MEINNTSKSLLADVQKQRKQLLTNSLDSYEAILKLSSEFSALDYCLTLKDFANENPKWLHQATIRLTEVDYKINVVKAMYSFDRERPFEDLSNYNYFGINQSNLNKLISLLTKKDTFPLVNERDILTLVKLIDLSLTDDTNEYRLFRLLCVCCFLGIYGTVNAISTIIHTYI